MQAEDLFRLAALPPAELRALAETVSGTLMPGPQVSATPLGYDWGSPVTAGLWRVEVTSRDRGGAPGCTFFVKLVRHIGCGRGCAGCPTTRRGRNSPTSIRGSTSWISTSPGSAQSCLTACELRSCTMSAGPMRIT